MRGSATVLFFATARVAVGTARLAWPIPETGLTVRALVGGLRERFPELGPTLASSRFVLNGRYLTRLSARIRDGDEFAVHPPYGGG